MPRKKTKLHVRKGSWRRRENEVEENDDAASSATQRTAISDTATTQDTTVSTVIEATPQDPPIPKKRNRKIPSPGPVRRSKRIRSRSSSVGEEADVVIASSSKDSKRKDPLERIEDNTNDVTLAPAIAGPSTSKDTAIAGPSTTRVADGLDVAEAGMIQDVPEVPLGKNVVFY